MTETKSLKHIISTLTPDQIAKAAPHLMRLDTLAKRQSERDTEVVESIIRVLRHRKILAAQLREALKGESAQ